MKTPWLFGRVLDFKRGIDEETECFRCIPRDVRSDELAKVLTLTAEPSTPSLSVMIVRNASEIAERRLR